MHRLIRDPHLDVEYDISDGDGKFRPIVLLTFSGSGPPVRMAMSFEKFIEAAELIAGFRVDIENMQEKMANGD